MPPLTEDQARAMSEALIVLGKKIQNGNAFHSQTGQFLHEQVKASLEEILEPFGWTITKYEEE